MQSPQRLNNHGMTDKMVTLPKTPGELQSMKPKNKHQFVSTKSCTEFIQDNDTQRRYLESELSITTPREEVTINYILQQYLKTLPPTLTINISHLYIHKHQMLYPLATFTKSICHTIIFDTQTYLHHVLCFVLVELGMVSSYAASIFHPLSISFFLF